MSSNPFPVAGMLPLDTQFYLGTLSSGSSPSNFSYITYGALEARLIALDDDGLNDGGNITFGGDNFLVPFTYEKTGDALAAFSTQIAGSKRYLNQGESGRAFFGEEPQNFLTQGLPDLWSGYFGQFITADTKTALSIDGSSGQFVVIPREYYIRSNSCNITDNTEMRGLYPDITNWRAGNNTEINFSTKGLCASPDVVNYCQNGSEILGFCGETIGDIMCYGRCSDYTVDSNNPFCFVDREEDKFACANYQESTDQNEGGSVYAQWWFILIDLFIIVLVIAIALFAVFKKNKR